MYAVFLVIFEKHVVSLNFKIKLWIKNYYLYWFIFIVVDYLYFLKISLLFIIDFNNN